MLLLAQTGNTTDEDHRKKPLLLQKQKPRDECQRARNDQRGDEATPRRRWRGRRRESRRAAILNGGWRRSTRRRPRPGPERARDDAPPVAVHALVEGLYGREHDVDVPRVRSLRPHVERAPQRRAPPATHVAAQDRDAAPEPVGRSLLLGGRGAPRGEEGPPRAERAPL